MADFDGAKLALLAEGRILTMLRDDIPTIPFPGLWDLPGGGREGQETPEHTVLRETLEETGLAVPETALIWKQTFPGLLPGQGPTWFFAARVGPEWIGREALGDEGQALIWMPLPEYLGHPKAIAGLVARANWVVNGFRVVRQIKRLSSCPNPIAADMIAPCPPFAESV